MSTNRYALPHKAMTSGRPPPPSTTEALSADPRSAALHRMFLNWPLPCLLDCSPNGLHAILTEMGGHEAAVVVLMAGPPRGRSAGTRRTGGGPSTKQVQGLRRTPRGEMGRGGETAEKGDGNHRQGSQPRFDATVAPAVVPTVVPRPPGGSGIGHAVPSSERYARRGSLSVDAQKCLENPTGRPVSREIRARPGPTGSGSDAGGVWLEGPRF